MPRRAKNIVAMMLMMISKKWREHRNEHARKFDEVNARNDHLSEPSLSRSQPRIAAAAAAH